MSSVPGKIPDVERWLDQMVLRQLEEDRVIFDLEGYQEDTYDNE